METITGQEIFAGLPELQQQRTSVSRSRWRMSEEEAYHRLEWFYKNEVGESYIGDFDTEKHIRAVARYMTEPQRSFGIALCGTCGNGKTTLMNAIRKMHYSLGHRVESTNTTRIVNFVRAGKEIPLEFMNEPFLCIDELTNEPAKVSYFGDQLTPIKDILEHRYASRLFTIVTTNASPALLEEWYGSRVRDRFREMFIKIDFNNQSFR